MHGDRDAVRGLCKHLFWIAVAEAAFAGEIAVQAFMQHRLRRIERRERIDHRRQRLVVDLDQVERVLGEIAVGGDDDRDRLADIAHAADRDRPAFDRRLDPDRKACRQRGYLVAGDDGDDARRGARRVDIYMCDPRMRVRRPQNGGVQRAGLFAEIVDEASAPGQERGVFDALD